jgi:hypothetical protein
VWLFIGMGACLLFAYVGATSLADFAIVLGLGASMFAVITGLAYWTKKWPFDSEETGVAAPTVGTESAVPLHKRYRFVIGAVALTTFVIPAGFGVATGEPPFVIGGLILSVSGGLSAAFAWHRDPERFEREGYRW